MKPKEISQALRGLPHMTLAQGEAITGFLHEHGLRRILELGFAHGVSTCYLAAAVAERGDGHVTTIDQERVRDLSPNIEDLLARLGLQDRVTVHFEPRSYLWRLMKMLEQEPRPSFDLCYLDGAHSWAVDGFAFLLIDRLLAPGGWIILDDLEWTHAKYLEAKGAPIPGTVPREELETAQVRKVWELLVKPHPCYGEFLVKDGWGYARKVEATPERAGADIQTEVVHETRHVGLGAALLRVTEKAARVLRRRR
jgi:predicted O-methyltransferase YrrM